MAINIKIVKTQTKIYRVADQDMVIYEENDVVNTDQAVLYDLMCLEDESLDWDDLNGIEDDTEYVGVLVEQENFLTIREIPINENNTERDGDLFPDMEDAPDELEKPVAGELDAGNVVW